MLSKIFPSNYAKISHILTARQGKKSVMWTEYLPNLTFARQSVLHIISEVNPVFLYIKDC